MEDRRHTEITDSSKLDTSRWMPLPRYVPRGQQSPGAIKRSSRDERQESIDETTTSAENRYARIEHESIGRPQSSAIRSYSTDVTATRNIEKSIVEQRRHTDCSDPRTIATRWIPQVNGGKFRRESSPLARDGCEITQSAATRWITFAKSPSPNPIPRNPERRDSPEHNKKDEEPRKDTDASKWQPSRKFSPAKNEKGHLQRQDELDIGRDRSSSCIDANDRANKLSQRMRDLYDFKTENEWPKRAGTSQRDNAWISKSSSEEERNYRPVRRNSQDLEFNDRIDIFKSKVEHEEEDDRRQPYPKRSIHDASEVFTNEQEDERLRRFNDRVRYSEDRNMERAGNRARGRTYSDDYDEKMRRASRRPSESPTFRRDQADTPTRRPLVNQENKRNSDASARSRDSRLNSGVSYVEVDFSKRDPRTSDASYVSVNLGKRGSVECKSAKTHEPPPRRAFSQTDERRPSTPVPPIEFNDERYVPKKLSSEPVQRDSTRYKVYLT